MEPRRRRDPAAEPVGCLTVPEGDRVARLGAGRVARAVTSGLVGHLRPSRPDPALLAALAGDLERHELPRPRGQVRLRVLPQVPRRVGTRWVAEGLTAPPRVDSAMRSFVVEHRDLRLLVDPAVCLDVGRRVLPELPPALRVAVRPPDGVLSTVESLALVGLAPEDIHLALATHLHWDHVSGLLDLPGLETAVHAPEARWALAGPVAPAGGVREALRHRSVTTFALEGPPVLTFARSHDLTGDGSVVVVDLPGHTPGHVGLLLHTGPGWVLLAGDAVWHGLQVEHLRRKPGYPGGLADVDRGEAFVSVHRLHVARDRVAVVPSHDASACGGVTEGQSVSSAGHDDVVGHHRRTTGRLPGRDDAR